jgi:hypothetical protein
MNTRLSVVPAWVCKRHIEDMCVRKVLKKAMPPYPLKHACVCVCVSVSVCVCVCVCVCVQVYAHGVVLCIDDSKSVEPCPHRGERIERRSAERISHLWVYRRVHVVHAKQDTLYCCTILDL